MDGEDARFTAALVASGDGEWEETIRLCLEVLVADPLHVGAGNLFATALHMLRSARDEEAKFKLLSVLFVDVGGSSRLTSVLGPERWRRHLLMIQSVVARSVARFEGYIHNYEGDAVLASFSFPRPHEDDARRAVLCGLAIIDEAKEVSQRINAESAALGSSDRFSVRVGIDTGRLVVGPSGSLPFINAADLVGDAVNFASRLQHCATRTGIAISDRTLASVRGYFRTESEGPLELRSFSSQVIHHVLGSTRAEDRLHATSHRTPLVGRLDEIAKLEAGWSRVVAGGRFSILLCGEAGVGKSRLAEVVVDLARAAGRPVIELRCTSLMRASAFGAIGALLHRFLRLDDAQRPLTIEIVGERLRDTVGDVLSEWVPGIVGRLVGVDELPEVLPEELRALSFQALIELVRAAASTGPALLLVEDVHEADPSTLALLSLLQAHDGLQSCLTLMTSRQDLVGSPPRDMTVEVDRLSPAESRELVGCLLADGSPDAIARLAERSFGVPLYAEELCLRDEPGDPLVPDTVEAILLTRLDALDIDAQAVADGMAVVGQEIADDVLGELVDIDPSRLEVALGHLMDQRIIVAVAAAERPTYRLRHDLVQTVAYDRILPSRRTAAHARCAALLTSSATTGGPRRPELIAKHYMAAGEPAAALTWWKHAAERAVATAAHDEAVSHFEHALEIVRASEAGTLRDLQEFELSLRLGLSESASHGYASPLAFGAFSRAQVLTADVPRSPVLIPAVWGLWSFHLIRGDLRTAAALAVEAAALAADGDPSDEALAAGITGTQRLFEGRFAEAAEALEVGKGAVGPRALQIPQDPQLAGQCQLAIALWHIGRTVTARAEMAACVAAAEAASSPRADFTRAFVFSYAAWLHELIGDSHQALELATAAQRVAVERHFGTWQLAAHLHIACARGSLGFPVEAVASVTSGLHVWRELGGARLMVPYFLARRGWAHLATGDYEAAMSDAAEGLALGQATGQAFHNAELLRLLAVSEATAAGADGRWRETIGRAERTAAAQGADLLVARAVVQRLDLDGVIAAESSSEGVTRLAGALDDDPLDPTIAALSRYALATPTMRSAT